MPAKRAASLQSMVSLFPECRSRVAGTTTSPLRRRPGAGHNAGSAWSGGGGCLPLRLEAPLQQYGNRSGTSGVTHYEIGPESIRVRFGTPTVYVYDYTTPGRDDVEHMKELARAGKGLSTYISRQVRQRYARTE